MLGKWGERMNKCQVCGCELYTSEEVFGGICDDCIDQSMVREGVAS